MVCNETKKIAYNYLICNECIWDFIDGCDGVPEYGPCVYALIDEYRQIVYIGKTKTPGDRLNQHLRTEKKFDRMVILSWNQSDEHALEFEGFAIEYLKPMYNKVKPKREGKKYMGTKLRKAMKDYDIRKAPEAAVKDAEAETVVVDPEPLEEPQTQISGRTEPVRHLDRRGRVTAVEIEGEVHTW